MKAILFGLLGISLAQAGSVTVIDLGGFGGSSGVGYRINASGVVVGWAQTTDGTNHALKSSGGGSPTNLNPAAASESYAYGINSAGTVVGTSYIGGQAHGTVWSAGGSVLDLGAGTFATGVNDGGAVAGGDGTAFIDSNGWLQHLGTLPGGTWSSAYGINNSGEVVGYGSTGSGFRGFIYVPGVGLTMLGTLGGLNSYAMAVNAGGEVVGHAANSAGYEHAFAITHGTTLTDLGTLGGYSSYAYGVNDAGVIVGYSMLQGTGAQRAFVYSNGQMQDLNSLVPVGSGWVFEQAYGINNAGDIVGVGTYQGQERAFLIDPIDFNRSASAATPEPGTFGLMGVGLVLAGLLGRRMRG